VGEEGGIIRVEGVCESLQPAFIITFTYWGCASQVCSFFVCLQMTHFDWPIKKKYKKPLILCSLSKIQVSIGQWSAFPFAHHSIWGTQFKEGGGGFGVMVTMGKGYVSYYKIVWKFGACTQNVMSQSIVQGTFEHFLKGDEDELWICSMNCCTIYSKSF
jgi:hypothetical protein